MLEKNDATKTELTDEALEDVAGGVYHPDGGCTPGPTWPLPGEDEPSDPYRNW